MGKVMNVFKKSMLICLMCAISLSILQGCQKLVNTSEKVREENKKTTNDNTKYPEEFKLVESDGTEITMEKTPERIVVLSYGSATIMDALGIKLVGIATTNREISENLKSVPQVGSPMKPNMEKIIKLKPDLIVISSSFKASQKKMFEDNGLTTYFIDNQKYEDTIKSLEYLGKAFGKEEMCQKLSNEIKEREKKLLYSVKGKTPPKVLVIFGTTQSFQIATEDSYSGNMIKKLGGLNIAPKVENSSNSYLPLSVENVVKDNPDIILRITHGSWDKVKDNFKKDFEENPLWESISAVKNSRVYDMDPHFFHANPGILTIDALEQLAQILYQ